MYLNNDEYPTPLLRWNNVFNKLTLQQQWQCRDGSANWAEWRNVPIVTDAKNEKIPISLSVMD